MRVTELTAYHVRIPLKRTIRHASYTRNFSDNLVMRCRLDCGVQGWGESVPRPYVTGETIETCFDLLRAADLRSLVGGPITNLEDAVQRIHGMPFLPRLADRRSCFGNAAQCALELSVLDAAARAEGVPLSRVTELVPETAKIRTTRNRVRYSAAITSMSPLRETIQAWKFRVYGFRECKVKVGVRDRDDRATLARVRRILGSRVSLRIDANESWQCNEIEAKLATLLPFDICSVEQPVPHTQVDGLAQVKANIPVPIMLDESLCSLEDARHAIESGLCDLFNIRLSKCGGFVNSLRIAAAAHQAGLGYQLGCQVGETGILSAAGRHFATSVNGIQFLEGSYDRHLVRERLTVEDMTFGRGGYASAISEPGLGVHVDPNALDRCTLAKEHWDLS